MRYFTRQLYNGISWIATGSTDDGFETRIKEASHAWSEVNQCYLSYLRDHESQLSDAVKKLTSCALHDSRITRVQETADSLELLLDTRHAPLFKDTSVSVMFLGVRNAHGLQDLVDQTILYEELYICDSGKFEFSVLCTRSEFGFLFSDVELLPTSTKKENGSGTFSTRKEKGSG
jgi:hypothetical protein